MIIIEFGQKSALFFGKKNILQKFVYKLLLRVNYDHIMKSKSLSGMFY